MTTSARIGTRPAVEGEPARLSGVDDVDPRVARSRARLLAAATEIIVESGARALTVDAVAERSGVAKSTLYRHFPSREALVVDVLRCNVPDIPPSDPDLDFETRLRTHLRALADTLADPEWRRILPDLLALRQQLPEIDQLTADDRADKEATLAAILDAGVAEGRIPEGLDVHDVATLLFGPMVMAALFGDVERMNRVADYAVERFLESYRT